MVASTEHLGSLRSLQRLLLVGNRVDSVGELSELPQLSDLDLKFNYITKMAEVRKLAHNPQLRSLMLHGNPVAKLPTYRAVRPAAGRKWSPWNVAVVTPPPPLLHAHRESPRSFALPLSVSSAPDLIDALPAPPPAALAPPRRALSEEWQCGVCINLTVLLLYN